MEDFSSKLSRCVVRNNFSELDLQTTVPEADRTEYSLLLASMVLFKDKLAIRPFVKKTMASVTCYVVNNIASVCGILTGKNF